MIDNDPYDFSGLEQQYGLPDGLLSAVANKEDASGDPNAVSPKGAIGTFQFLPQTAKDYGIDPTNKEQAAEGAARMFADLKDQYNGDIPHMLAAYNWGSGNLDKNGIENAPAETKDYIANILPQVGQPNQQVADSGQIASDARPSLDDIFNPKPSLDDIFSQSPQDESPVNAGNTDKFDTISDNSLQGATFGLGNRTEAGLAALVASGINGKPISENYETARKTETARLKQESSQNPLLALTSNVGGALATGGLGADTAAGSAITDFLRAGNTGTRIAKGAVAGAASGALYGAGSADYDQTLEGAKQGAIFGGATGGLIPAAGATISDVAGTLGNTAKGIIAKSPDAVQKIAETLKSNAGNIYQKMTAAGADFKQSATQGFLAPGIDNALGKLNFIPSLTPQTNSIVQDLKDKIASGNLGLDQLDQYRRQLGRVQGGEEGVAAGAVRRTIDDFVDGANASHLANGSTDAVKLLNQGRQQYKQASKYEDISDILSKAQGDPSKIKSGLAGFINKGGADNWTPTEQAALKSASRATKSELLLQGLGRFGISIKDIVPAGVGADTAYNLAGEPAALSLLAGGTVARQAQKLAARGKAQGLLNVIQSGGGGSAVPNAPVSPLLSYLAGTQVSSPSRRIGLQKVGAP